MNVPGVKFNFPVINNQPSNHFLDFSFDYKELSIALSNVNKESALGFNRISFKIITKLSEFVKRKSSYVYNDMIHTSNFPRRNYLCFFILKANSNKVRPISISSCSLKLLEKMIKERLTQWMEHNNLINNSQFSFRMNRSCVDSLPLLTSETEKFY